MPRRSKSKAVPPPPRESARAARPTGRLPERLDPMLAQACDEPFDSAEHLFEIKWDGTRCLAFVEEGRLRLQNRRDIEMRPRYPELECLLRLPSGTLLDGEIVVLDGGKPSFNKLQQREHLQDPTRVEIVSKRLPATLMAFDLLYVEGESWLRRPLTERRARLAELVAALGSPHVVCADYIVGSGGLYFAAAEQHGLEGIMAKKLDSTYSPGKRSPAWLKIKVAQTGRFQIIGYTPHESNAAAIGALIIGEPSGRRWHYKGKVGSGFTELEREQFKQLLDAAPPLDHPPSNGPKDGVWRRAGYHCLVRFFEKTGVGMLRAPVFKGLVK